MVEAECSPRRNTGLHPPYPYRGIGNIGALPKFASLLAERGESANGNHGKRKR